jgi:hypothetical protein
LGRKKTLDLVGQQRKKREKKKKKKEKENKGRRLAAQNAAPMAGDAHPPSAAIPATPNHTTPPFRPTPTHHGHLLRWIPDPFRVNFQNIGFSFESKNDF